MTIKNPHINRTRDYDPATGKKLKRAACSARKRGGQPGNKNAYRHGFYSMSFTEAEMQALDSNVKGEFHDEINATRINTAHLSELMKDYRNMLLQDYISATNAFNNSVDNIRSLSREQKFMYQNQTTVEKALEELKNIPPEQD